MRSRLPVRGIKGFMATLMKCAACGADVEFPTSAETEEVVCPGCEVLVRRRPGDERMAMPVGMELPEEFRPLNWEALGKQSDLLRSCSQRQV